jgi:parallel beta-helix repeat protein
MIVNHRWIVLAAVMALIGIGCSKSETPSGNSGNNQKGGKVVTIVPGPNVQEETLKALIKAEPGDTVEFGEGTFEFTMGLSLAKEGVTLRGQGMDKTVLSFKKQDAGKEGLLVTRGNFVIENLTVEDTKGDAIKVNDVEGVTFRRVKAQWTGGTKETNGAYGLYPVQCKNVLIEECVAIGAADAGIYVGQSKNIIVRRCRAEQNVAGIEIENSMDADVYENVATNNAGGLLVFDLPGLQLKNGRRVRVFKNQVFANNHVNFAPKGTTVSEVAPGTGMVVMATDQVEIFENVIKDHQTQNLAIVSYHTMMKPIEDKDKDYDPYPEGIYVHDNQFANGGFKPAGQLAALFAALFLGKPVPDILYDGMTPPMAEAGKKFIFLKNNGNATFANIMWKEIPDKKSMSDAVWHANLLKHAATRVKKDIKEYEGELPPLPPVKLPGVNE